MILQSSELSPIERNILQLMVVNADDQHVCRMTRTEIAKCLGVATPTVRRAYDALRSRKYMMEAKGQANHSIPYPYVEATRRKPDKADRRQILIYVAQAQVIKEDLQRRERELTDLADQARRDGDQAERHRLLDQIDLRVDTLEAVDEFLQKYASDQRSTSRSPS